MSTPYEPLKQFDDTDIELAQKPSKFRSIARAIAIIGVFCFGAIYIGCRYFLSPPLDGQSTAIPGLLAPEPQLKQCPAPYPAPANAPVPLNLWAPLTPHDIASVQAWLESSPRNLNLSRTADVAENSIFLIEAHPPKKADALAYLSSPNTTTPPERYARVTIHHGAEKEPVIKDYLVGPLPVGKRTAMREMTGVYHRDIPYNARGYTRGMEFKDLLVDMLLSPGLSDAMQDLFGATARGLPNDTLIAGASAPFGIDGSFRRMWVTWRRNTAGPFLHPVGFFQYIEVSGTDKSQWKVLNVVYNHQIFPSVTDFLASYTNGTLARLPPRPDQSSDLSWSSRARPSDAPPRDLDNLPGPRAVSFAGLRFRVDKQQGYVSWMGWGVFLGFGRDMGLSLWDVRFKKERIIYELSPQEALAQYAGNDPLQSTTAWLDSYFGMGQSVRDLLPTYDCPAEAVFLPATTHSAAGTTTRARAICVFEHDTGRPLTRHWGLKRGEVGAVKGYTLVVRSVSTVGNYDYMFDYIFHLDGTMEVRISASGYLQGAYWEPKQEGYGTVIRDTTMGSLHDHVINFKVDLDVAGTANSLLRTTTALEEVEQPWFDEDWGRTVIQQKITKEYIESEDEARVNYPINFQGGYALVNKEETNRWGVPRGYSIHAGYSPVHNTAVGSKRLLRNANWAQNNLAFSLRKEGEPSSSTMWNLHLPGAPVVDFDKFFDGENITQADLVAWVNVGMHHLPQAEDSPNTRTNTAASSFFLTPLNYFDADASLDVLNAVLLDPEDGFSYDDYGVGQVHCVPTAPEPFSYDENMDVAMFDLDGVRMPPGSVSLEDRRATAEMYHRMQLG